MDCGCDCSYLTFFVSAASPTVVFCDKQSIIVVLLFAISGHVLSFPPGSCICVKLAYFLWFFASLVFAVKGQHDVFCGNTLDHELKSLSYDDNSQVNFQADQKLGFTNKLAVSFASL